MMGLFARGRGDEGERLAEKHIKKNGGRIVARNWRCPLGELDLIVLERKTLVFVEVKSRESVDDGFPAEAVDFGKRRKIERLACKYCQAKRVDELPIRFDIVEITWSKPPEINWIRGAWLEGE